MSFLSVVTASALLLVSGPSARAQDAEEEPQPRPLDELQAGQWVEVKGEYQGAGWMVADEIELLEPGDEFVLVGVVERPVYDKGRFRLVGHPIHTSDKTDWNELNLHEIAGKRVKVSGKYRGPGKFSAREIKLREKGRDSIEGRLDSYERTPEGRVVFVGNLRIEVPETTEFASTAPVADYELAPLEHQPLMPGEWVYRNLDDRIPGSFRITDQLRFGILAETELAHEDNLNLDAADNEDRTDLGFSLRAEMVWSPTPNFTGTIRGRFFGLTRDDKQDGSDTQGNARLSALWAYWRSLFGSDLGVQLGRQDFDEPREWVYDQNLDALRFIWPGPYLRAELSVSTALSNSSDYDEASTNYIAYLSNGDYRRHVAGYVIDRRDDRSPRNYPIHIGARLLGDWIPQNQVWLEAAALRGYADNVNLEGWGFDLGTTWKPDFTGPFNFTIGYAIGTGDDPDTPTVDETFRQTGLQDNNGRFAGVQSFRYYGALVDPELSNLGIFSLGVGARLDPSTSIDLVFHDYRQVQLASERMRTEIGRRTDGVHDAVGREIDLIVGARSNQNVELRLILGWFDPGSAYPDGDPAFLASMRVRYRF